MQDIEDFDPLDDILLSDDDIQDSKNKAKSTLTLFQKPKENKNDEQSKEEKKKKMLAELFGTDDSIVGENSKTTTEVTPASKKIDWLELKTEPKIEITENALTKSVSWQSPIQFNSRESDLFKEPLSPLASTNPVFNFDTSMVTDANSSVESKLNQKEKSTLQVSNVEVADRRKSEGGNSTFDLKRTKHRFKSLDLDLDLDFNTDIESKNKSSSNKIDSRETLEKNETKKVKQVDEVNKEGILESAMNIESTYIPSSSSTRRFGVSKSKPLQSNLTTTNRGTKLFNSDNQKDTLPSWLEPAKTEPSLSSAVSESFQSQRNTEDIFITSNKETRNKNDISTKLDENNKIDKNVTSSVNDLKKKKEELKIMAKSQADKFTKNELEIQTSALELMRQYRYNIKTLLEIIPSTSERDMELMGQEESAQKTQHLENTIAQLQLKLLQQELDKNEFEIKLKHIENKCSMDLAMLEDLHEHKLQINEEKENRLKKEIQNLEEEYNSKILKQKENEEEIIRTHKEKIRTMQEEHLQEVKYIIERQNARRSFMMTESLVKNDGANVDNELISREILLENRSKQLLEFEEQLNKEKVNLEGKKAGFNARVEEFEIKSTKERLSIEQQKRELKLAQTIFEEKETSWEKDKQREKEYLSNYKQELEIMKENSLKEETKLMKEKFEIATERARLEAIVKLEGNNQGSNILQSKAELEGTLKEINSIKLKLDTERNEIKAEERRLKEERWKLKDIEQQIMLQNKQYQRLFQESEAKREEGIQALKKAQKIESQMNEKLNEIEKKILELNKKEEQLTKEKIEISKERDYLNKQKYQLDMFLPQLTYEEKLPFNVLSKNIIDPRIMFLKLKAENDIESLFKH